LKEIASETKQKQKKQRLKFNAKQLKCWRITFIQLVPAVTSLRTDKLMQMERKWTTKKKKKKQNKIKTKLQKGKLLFGGKNFLKVSPIHTPPPPSVVSGCLREVNNNAYQTRPLWQKKGRQQQEQQQQRRG
jgi:hypothetical protein